MGSIDFDFSSFDLIDSYTRAQAISDGVLIDVSETAREVGFKVPVAITAAAWNDCVAWTKETAERKPNTYQDEMGRLWDVLVTAAKCARHSQGSGRLQFDLLRVPSSGKKTGAELATLSMISGPGDNLEHVITICMPDED